MAENYYVLLGVSPKADKNKIKQAYRKIAKTHHPDISHSSNGEEKFKEIKEAYDTLIDKNKRKQYDSDLKHSERSEKIKVRRAQSAKDRGSSSFESGYRNESAFYKNTNQKPCYNRSSGGRVIPETSAGMVLEAIMTPAEAALGGEFPLPLTIAESCPVCSHSFFFNLFRCPECSGTGRVKIRKTIIIKFPPNMNHGDRFRISLSNIGFQDMWMNIHVIVKSGL